MSTTPFLLFTNLLTMTGNTFASSPWWRNGSLKWRHNDTSYSVHLGAPKRNIFQLSRHPRCHFYSIFESHHHITVKKNNSSSLSQSQPGKSCDSGLDEVFKQWTSLEVRLSLKRKKKQKLGLFSIFKMEVMLLKGCREAGADADRSMEATRSEAIMRRISHHAALLQLFGLFHSSWMIFSLFLLWSVSWDDTKNRKSPNVFFRQLLISGGSDNSERQRAPAQRPGGQGACGGALNPKPHPGWQSLHNSIAISTFFICYIYIFFNFVTLKICGISLYSVINAS